ncbi:MAG: DUF433 domain-containing protein [Hymenobacteraceae bacterium]|nr:DUF433 domain-containing protein [Hymenobacteraceae bacterium]
MNITDFTAYIKANPKIRFGKPIVKGTRPTVLEVLEILANGRSAAGRYFYPCQRVSNSL